MRFGAGDRGKSGGVRIVYYFHSDAMPAYLLALFPKSRRANLPRAELNALANFVEALKRIHGR